MVWMGRIEELQGFVLVFIFPSQISSDDCENCLLLSHSLSDGTGYLLELQHAGLVNLSRYAGSSFTVASKLFGHSLFACTYALVSNDCA